MTNPETQACDTSLAINTSVLHPWSQRLLVPLHDTREPDAQETEAWFLSTDFLADSRWEFIETAMLKLGSLQHSEVDLPQVCEYTLQLLEQSSKDLRLLTHLLRALLQVADASALGLALQLLHLWLQHFASLFPNAGTPRQSRLLLQSLQRMQSCCSRLEPIDEAQWTSLLQHASQIKSLCQADKRDLSVASQHLQQAIQQLTIAQSSAQTGKPETATASDSATRNESPPGTMPEPAATELQHHLVNLDAIGTGSVDPGRASRSRRQTLLALATQLIQLDSGHPIGYRLRRFAIWSGIETLPNHSPQRRTELAAPDADRRHDYRQGLAHPSTTLWQQIEESLLLSPFWLEGHWYSAQMAQSLGHLAIAKAISQELKAFLQRLPGLEHLTFADGTPLLDEEARHWLQQEHAMQQASPFGITDIHTLDQLEAALQHSSSPEQQFHLQLALAHHLEQQQQTTLAAHSYRLLQQYARQLSLAEWNPQLLAQLAADCQRCPIPEAYD